MPQFNIHDAKTQFSQLLALVERGEKVVIARHGEPVAELVPVRRPGLVLGAGANDPNITPAAVAGDWWRPMTDEEADAFVEGGI